MNKLKKFLIILAGALFIIFVGITLYVKFYWKDILVSALSKGLKKEVTISDVYFRPPLGLSAYKVEVKDLLKADAVIADFSWNSVFEKKVIVSDLVFVRPFLNINIPKDGPVATQETSGQPKPPSGQQTSKQIEIWVKKFFIEEGELQYTNLSGETPFQFKLENVRFRAEDLYWPLMPAHTKFALTARLAKSQSPLSESKIEADGWLDWVKKDMEGTFKILEANQYAGLVANVKSQNNLMKVQGNFDMKNFPPIKNNSSEGGAINQIVYGALSNAGVKIGATFSFETKMDDFRISNITFSGNVVTQK